MRRKNDSLEYSKIMAEDYRIENVNAYKQEIEKAFDLYSKENGSIELNKYLTSKEHRHIEEFEKIAQNIITWIKANPLKRNITLYRAINLPKDIFEKYKKNLYVTGIGGIQSLTLSKEHALGFLNYHENNFPILLEISAQKGDMAAPPLRIKKGSMIGYPEEQEFDTLPTTKFKINSIRYNGKYYTFDVVME